MDNDASYLEQELTEKYKEEFESKLIDHRRKVVLDIAENIKMARTFDPRDLSTNVTIKL